MHLQSSHSHKKARSSKLLVLIVLAQHVTNVLAEEAFNAFAEFLYPVYVLLPHLPVGSGAWLEWRNFLVDLVIPRHICDQIFDHRKRLHWKDSDGLLLRQ